METYTKEANRYARNARRRYLRACHALREDAWRLGWSKHPLDFMAEPSVERGVSWIIHAEGKGREWQRPVVCRMRVYIPKYDPDNLALELEDHKVGRRTTINARPPLYIAPDADDPMLVFVKEAQQVLAGLLRRRSQRELNRDALMQLAKRYLDPQLSEKPS